MSTEGDVQPSRVLSIRLPADVYRVLKVYASLSESTLNAVVVRAVSDYLDRHASEEAIAALVEHHRAVLRGPGSSA